MTFIKGDKEEGCLFCTRIKRDQDREDLILDRGPNAFAILNKYPYNNGHLMVVPYQHTDNMDDLNPETAAELISYLARWSAVLEAAMKAQGFNIGVNLGEAAGAGIKEHLHFHLVPRWTGDTNFMPALAETKVIPDTLENTYDILTKAWRSQ